MTSNGGPTYRSNLPATANGHVRLLKFRDRKRRVLRAIEEEIACDEETISASNVAIATIEKTIAHSERALEIYESNLAALKEIKNRLQCVLPPLDLGLDSIREDESLAVCQRVTTYIGDSSGQEVEPLDEQHIGLEKKVRELASMLVSLRLELSDWQENLVVAEQSVVELWPFKRTLEPILERMDILLSPVRKVPSEVWERIFFLTIAGTGITPLPSPRDPTVTTLANVCQSWRRVALGQAKFWTRIDIPNTTWWPSDVMGIISTYIVRKASQCPTFIIRSWFTPTWLSQAEMSARRGSLYMHSVEYARYSQYPYTSASMPYDVRSYTGSQRADLSKVDIQSLYGAGNFSLHLYITPQVTSIDWRRSDMLYRAPLSITVQSTTPCASDHVLSQLANYPGCTSVTLIDVWPSTIVLSSYNISWLRRLCLQLSCFSPFNIQPLLNETLEELGLWHDGDATFDSLLSEHQLPTLHTLALSIHDVNLLTNLRTPKLKNLTIYGSPLPPKDSLDYRTLLGGGPASKLQQIKLAEWPGLEGSGDVVDAAQHLVALAPQLAHILFVDCALDGSRLLSKLKDDNETTFQELTIGRCSVITQAECEELYALVQKLHVYV